jgi:hypothetical protein
MGTLTTPGGSEEQVMRITQPSDYREVDGILLPFRFDEWITTHSVTHIHRIVTDPKVAAATFQR